MPHVTEHTPEVSTRSVKPYACESSREKRQQDGQTERQKDRQTDTQTDCPKPLFSTFWGLYIPNPVLSRSRFFARCQYFHWHGSNRSWCFIETEQKYLPCVDRFYQCHDIAIARQLDKSLLVRQLVGLQLIPMMSIDVFITGRVEYEGLPSYGVGDNVASGFPTVVLLGSTLKGFAQIDKGIAKGDYRRVCFCFFSDMENICCLPNMFKLITRRCVLLSQKHDWRENMQVQFYLCLMTNRKKTFWSTFMTPSKFS